MGGVNPVPDAMTPEPVPAPTDSPRNPDAPAISAGHRIVRQLEAEGVQRVYCVPGESYLDVLDGLYDSPIRTIVCRQEGGVGFMALAEGRMTGRAGIAMVTRGPGAANAMIAVHTAYQDGTPMVLFVGLIPRHERGRQAFQEFEIASWFGSTAKKVLVLDDAASAADIVAEAMATAASGRPGPVVVGLPEATLREVTGGRTVAPRPRPVAVPSAAAIDALEARIAGAERPLLVIGGEGWTAGSSEAIEAWARGRGMGIVADFRAYDGIDHDSPAYLGALGFGSAAVSTRVLVESDLLVFLGTVRGDVSSGGFQLAAATPTVVVNADPDLRGHFGRVDEQIVAATPAFAHAIAARFAGGVAVAERTSGADTPDPSGESPSGDAPDWLSRARAEFLAWRTPVPEPAEVAAHNAAQNFVDLDTAFGIVQELLPRRAIVACGAGNYAIWGTRFLPAHEFPSQLGPRNGAMGFGLPAAVAAGLEYPERPVLALAGDGCFQMNGQEFATAVAEGVNLTVLVVDNSRYGTIVAHQAREYPGRPSGTTLSNPDFAAIAAAHGGLGFTVNRTEDFRDAFERALAHDGPALVHLIADPEVRLPRTEIAP